MIRPSFVTMEVIWQKSDEVYFEEYVRGGVDILYDKIMASATKPEDYIKEPI